MAHKFVMSNGDRGTFDLLQYELFYLIFLRSKVTCRRICSSVRRNALLSYGTLFLHITLKRSIYSQILGTNSAYFVQYLGVVKGLVRHLTTLILSILIMIQDFGDGPSGAVYQKQLNCFVRYCRKTYPAEFHDTFRGRGHAISDILHQIEIKSGSITTATVGLEEPHQHRLDALAAADENLK